MEYHYGIPGYLVWLSHIISGLLLIYVGYQTLNKRGIDQKISLILIIMGSIALLYHAHILLTHS